MRLSQRFWCLIALFLLILWGCGDDSSGPGNPPGATSSSFVHSVGDTSFDVAFGVAALSNGTRVATGGFTGSAKLHMPSAFDMSSGVVEGARLRMQALGLSAGTTADSLIGAGGTEVFVVGYDANGKRTLARSFGGPNDDIGLDAAPHGDGFVATGLFQGSVPFGATSLTSAGDGDVYLARFDGAGNPIWAVRAGGTGSDQPWRVGTDGNGDILITGAFEGTADFGATTLTSDGADDAFVAKYSSTGSVVWAKRFGGVESDLTFGVCADGAQNVYASGIFRSTVDFGAGAVTSQGQGDVFLVKLAPNGAFQWVRTGGSTMSEEGLGVACDASGNTVQGFDFQGSATFGTTTLTSNGGSDGGVISYSAAGDIRWVRHYGGAGAIDAVVGVVISGGRTFAAGVYGETVAFGATTLTSAGLYDAFLAELDGVGGVVWAESGGGTFADIAYDIARGGGRIVIGGFFTGSALFGDGLQLNGEGENDGFIYQR